MLSGWVWYVLHLERLGPYPQKPDNVAKDKHSSLFF